MTDARGSAEEGSTVHSHSSDAGVHRVHASSVLHSCWGYKRGDGLSMLGGTAFKKRFFVVTDDHSLRYYASQTDHDDMSPKGELSCIDMTIERDSGVQKIDGISCFTFTLTAAHGTRTSKIECACENVEQRASLIAAIERVTTQEKHGSGRRIEI